MLCALGWPQGRKVLELKGASCHVGEREIIRLASSVPLDIHKPSAHVTSQSFKDDGDLTSGVVAGRDFWYEFFPGERLGVVGANGAGKSSLLRMVAGQLPLSAGNVTSTLLITNQCVMSSAWKTLTSYSFMNLTSSYI